jgi:hypothetical protein
MCSVTQVSWYADSFCQKVTIHTFSVAQFVAQNIDLPAIRGIAGQKRNPLSAKKNARMGVMIPEVYASERRSNEKSEDVDLKRRLIYVRDAKFKKSRYVPISQSAADHLASYCMTWATRGSKRPKAGGEPARTPKKPLAVCDHYLRVQQDYCKAAQKEWRKTKGRKLAQKSFKAVSFSSRLVR